MGSWKHAWRKLMHVLQNKDKDKDKDRNKNTHSSTTHTSTGSDTSSPAAPSVQLTAVQRFFDTLVESHGANTSALPAPTLRAASSPKPLNTVAKAVAGEDMHCAPWALAEQIVKVALRDPALEDRIVQLLTLLQEASKSDNAKLWLLTHVLDVIDQTQDVLSYVLQDGVLKNAFDPETALVTVYYMMVFFTACSCVPRSVQPDKDADTDTDTDSDTASTMAAVHALLVELEPVCVHIATLMTKLLLNTEVYDTVADCWEHVEQASCWNCVSSAKKRRTKDDAASGSDTPADVQDDVQDDAQDNHAAASDK